MKLYRNIHLVLIIAAIMSFFIAGCGKKNVPADNKQIINNAGSGKIDLSGKEPDIQLSDITAVIGTNIDYTSDIKVKDEEKYPDLEVWVNASGVDIYEPGSYKAVYTFFWGDNEVSKTITVNIIEDNSTNENKTDEISAGDSDYVNADTTKNNNNTTTKGNTTTKNNGDTTTKGNATTKNNGNATTKGNTTTKNNGNITTKGNTTTKNNGNTTTKDNTTTKNSGNITTKGNTTTRKYISGNEEKTTVLKDLGYVYIELLSGDTVKIKTTSARYIVSTRTDISYTTKNGYRYEVSKLIIKFSTGTEQVLETVEKRLK